MLSFPDRAAANVACAPKTSHSYDDQPMPTPLTLREQLNQFFRLLRENGVDSPRLSAEVLLASALGLERNELLKRLLLAPDAPLAEQDTLQAERLVARRAKGEPVAYIIGNKEFYGRDFSVSPATLTPRPETELLVDLALEEMRQRPGSGLFADFGTGTGCIAISLALARPDWRGSALDISPEALQVAIRNARRYGTRNVRFIQADFTTPPFALESLDLLVSNPPYVSEAEYAVLSREVRNFEPKSALVPAWPRQKDVSLPARRSVKPNSEELAAEQTGCDFFPAGKSSGLEHALVILAEATRLLKPGGRLLMEIGHRQAQALLGKAREAIWSEAHIYKDLAGLDRVFSVRKRHCHRTS